MLCWVFSSAVWMLTYTLSTIPPIRVITVTSQMRHPGAPGICSPPDQVVDDEEDCGNAESGGGSNPPEFAVSLRQAMISAIPGTPISDPPRMRNHTFTSFGGTASA